MNQYYNPVRTIQGVGCVEEIGALLRSQVPEGAQILLLVWNESVFELPAFAALDDTYSVHKVCFNESNPTVEQLFDLFCQTRDCIPAFVIAVGGGSIMDVGKALCCLYGKEVADTDALRRIISNKEYGIPAARWIGVPTTAGTGSETTCWATIWDPTKDCKRSIESRDNYAWAALVDPDLASGMPIGLAVSSALDAMAHAVESYWARATNCVSRALALQAVRTIMGAMDDLLDGKAQAHDAMAQGSMLAGLAFSNTKTTACHSISYPLTMHYHIPHGAAVSLLLAPMLAVNAAKITDLSALLDALQVRSADELEDRIRGYLARAGLPVSLEAWGVRWEDLHHLAALGLTPGRADNNPVDINPEMIETILEKVYPTYEMSKGA